MDAAWNIEHGHGLGPDPEGVREVVVLRPGGLAAVIDAVPALRHLRRLYPAARITVAVERDVTDLVSSCPYVDRAVDLSRPSELLIEPFDVAVLCDLARGGTSSGVQTPGASGVRGGGPTLDTITARCRVAYRAPDQTARYHVHPDAVGRAPEHIRLLRLVWLLGGDAPDARIGLWPSLADRNGAAEMLAGIDRPVALLHPAHDVGAAQGWRRDLSQRVAAVLHDHGLQPVLVGRGSHDESDTSATGDVRLSGVIDLTDVPTVGQLVGLVERASLYVGVDDGIAAMALAVGMQSVIADVDVDAHMFGAPASTVTCIDAPAGFEDAIVHEQLLGAVATAAGRATRAWRRAQV